MKTNPGNSPKKGSQQKDVQRPIQHKDLPDTPNLDLPPGFAEILKAIPEDKRNEFSQILVAATVKSSSYRGPVPPPDIALGWNKVTPKGGDRILKMAEMQQDHRMKLEEYAVRAQHSQSARGQFFAFILGLFGMGGAVYLAMNGHEWVAGTFATTLIIGLVSVFITGKVMQTKDLKQKESKEKAP